MSLYLPDTNVWLALSLPLHVHHMGARAWLDSVQDEASIYFCRSTQQSFLRLLCSGVMLTRIANTPSPLTNEAAWAAYEALLADDRIVFQPDEPAGIERYWQHYGARATSSPNLWMDAYLAAFARAADYQFVTTDVGFRQFADLNLLLLNRSASPQ
jgi:toxin-antitoxin system PIN domain toxin